VSKKDIKQRCKKMKIGDQILIHLTGNKTAGICKVIREYFENNSQIWHSDDIYRHRIGIEPLKLPSWKIAVSWHVVFSGVQALIHVLLASS
jgi:hypothetical protein